VTASPRAAYRLQLTPDFGFAAARGLVPYLRELGISHLYLSPSLQARRGSSHGYDVVDPTQLSDELGGEDQFRALASAGLGVILDVVPNHMGTGEENRWWSDETLRERWFDLDPAGGYRRFFDIDDLAAIRQERDEVFETSHAKIFELIRDGLVSGLRIDHPDGLADPGAYLRRLAERGAPRVWVEKILHPGEHLRDWPVSGTVGYEFLNDACALYVDPTSADALSALNAEVTGEQRSFGEVALEAKLEQATGTFARELARLERLGPFDTRTLAQGLARLLVYRTYVEPATALVTDADRAAVEEAQMDSALAAALLLEDPSIVGELVTRFQQTSPAIAAKGAEDTAFYRYLRLLALNDVGGDPDRFGLSVSEFHAANAERAERFPESLVCTQTHDTKRSGDTRARIGAISEIPGDWAEHVRRWIEHAQRLGESPPGPVLYLLLQTLVGTWPISAERLDRYLLKALREAKQETSWSAPDESFEEAVIDFSHRLVADDEFQASFEPFSKRLARRGERSALGQLLLALTVPGVPALYQGDELWCFALVDPDNRRPVDWDRRRRLLGELRSGAAMAPEARKLRLIVRALDLRARRPGSFAGSYTPLEAGVGVCAYLRGADVLVVAALRPDGGEELAEAPGGTWRELLSGASHYLGRRQKVATLVGTDGIALLERESARS
jgi:(1->4)-alpha-D-glucan 1-alpha-D-glucosylmutase